jgi:WD40 repeat protein
MVMALALHQHHQHDRDSLALAVGNEGGATYVQVFRNSTWSTVYSSVPHTQPVLSLGMAPGAACYFTSSADALVASHPFPVDVDADDACHGEPRRTVRTGHAGQQGLAVRADGRIFATAGWDARVRVYSSKTLAELAVLKWHKEGCYAVTFGHVAGENTPVEKISTKGEQQQQQQAVKGTSEESTETATVAKTGATALVVSSVRSRREQKTKDTHWLAAGSKDGKISLWEIF